MSTDLPVCATRAECDLHDGRRVTVVGVYTVWDPLPERSDDHPPPTQVLLTFAGGEEGPYLEAFGYDGHHRELDEIARYRDRTVRVTGTFLREMPPHPTDPPWATSLAGACIHPVEAIEAA